MNVAFEISTGTKTSRGLNGKRDPMRTRREKGPLQRGGDSSHGVTGEESTRDKKQKPFVSQLGKTAEQRLKLPIKHMLQTPLVFRHKHLIALKLGLRIRISPWDVEALQCHLFSLTLG
ncbi:hypothetical protein NQZ68_032064 [Dissostichus eleginoides]|nr:hypothetical protein NQZ68_032064 [Dissostichus eleginoides]